MAQTYSRRQLLAITGAGLVTGSAGCIGSASIGDDGTGEITDPTTAASVDVVSLPIPGFEPGIVHLEPGATVEWTVVENHRHTVTAYHPDTYGPQRIPESAEPWDSGHLREGHSFEWTFEHEGIYDYVDTYTLCATHESLGAVGRVIVGWPDIENEPACRHDADELPGRAARVVAEYDEACREALG